MANTVVDWPGFSRPADLEAGTRRTPDNVLALSRCGLVVTQVLRISGSTVLWIWGSIQFHCCKNVILWYCSFGGKQEEQVEEPVQNSSNRP
jgi:hypothetical protein